MKIMLIHTDGMINDTGGTAKVASLLANDMYMRGHEVTLLYSSDEEGEFFFEISPEVKSYNLAINQNGSKIKKPVYLKVWREAIRLANRKKATIIDREFIGKYLIGNLNNYLDIIKPDIIISFRLATSSTLLCDLKTGIPVITMSHGQPHKEYDKKETEALEKSAVYQVLVPSFEKYINRLLPKVKTVTIGNAIQQFEFSADLASKKALYKIVNVGRIVKGHKRQHLLLQAFEKIADKYPDWIVEMWGAIGNKIYYAEMQEFIKSHNLANRIFFKGMTNNIGDVLRQADIFAFPSAHEGFGMALAEAMSVGLPAVGYKNCGGVNKLIIDNKTGFLCDEGMDAFSIALEKLMSNQSLRVQMGNAAKKDMEQYAPKKIFDQWEELIKKVAEGAKKI